MIPQKYREESALKALNAAGRGRLRQIPKSILAFGNIKQFSYALTVLLPSPHGGTEAEGNMKSHTKSWI